jgi:hypothetical protein
MIRPSKREDKDRIKLIMRKANCFLPSLSASAGCSISALPSTINNQQFRAPVVWARCRVLPRYLRLSVLGSG